MTITTTRPRHSIRFRGRSFLALVLAPEAPLEDWLQDLDAWLERSPGFFMGRPVVLDVTALPVEKDELAGLVADLMKRDIRVMAVDGVDQALLGLGLPPMLANSRQSGLADVLDAQSRAAAPHPQPMIVDGTVRSGQSIIFPQGDVVVMGSVSSGAEVIAGGCIHVYGALRGRAIAGSAGNAQARIYCRKFEAELVAIDGLYRTADELEPQLRGRPVQARLDGDAILITALD